MHAPASVKRSTKNPKWEKRLEDLLVSCLRGERDLPTDVACLECSRKFQGANCWDKMMDHVAGRACQLSGNGTTLWEKQGGEVQDTHPFVKWALKEKIIERGLGGGFPLCEKNGSGHQFQEGKIETTLSYNPTGPFSDSGYASMGRNQDLNNEDNEDEVRTVCTDGQELDIEEEAKEKLVSTFSSETMKHLYSTLGSMDSRRSVAKSLVELLKEFSIRLQSGANPGQQKDTSVFIRHYRQ
jgi:hypothetical protein